MKISSIKYPVTNYSAKKNIELNSAQAVLFKQHTGFSKITFKGGNANQVMHIVAEMPPYFKTGGVATVANDYKSLTSNADTTMVMPYYNGKISYDSTGSIINGIDVLRVPKNLPADHPLKQYEGKPFFTNKDLDKVSIDELLKNPKNIVILDEIDSSAMQWGLEEHSPKKLLHVPNTNHYMVFTEETASMKVPYQGGGYSTSSAKYAESWKGDPYAKFDKAAVEYMQKITQHKGNGYDPGTIICSDSHAAYVTHWMAKNNASGDPFFVGKKPTQVGHNLGNGYIGETSTKNMFINLGATKNDIEKVLASKEYAEALQTGKEAEFFMQYIKPLEDGFQRTNAMEIPIYYGKQGFLPTFSTVSEGYKKTLLANENISPALQKSLKELSDINVFTAITNPLNDPAVTPYKKLGLPGYGEATEITLANGTKTVVEPFKYVDEAKAHDLNYVRNEVKKANKINLIDRLSGKYDGIDSKLYGKIIAGLEGKDITVHGKLDPQYITKLRQGEDVKMIVACGRGDFQKALESTIDGWAKYVLRTGDTNTLLVLGGALEKDTPTYKIIMDKIGQVAANPKLNGKFAFFEGFAPYLPLTMAGDLASIPSRTAPCELTDLEAKRMLCPTVVTDCQGLGQKNFDPDRESEKALADGFKTKHEYFMSEEEALKDGVASKEAKEKFLSTKNKIVAEESLKYKNRTGNTISEELLLKKLKQNPDYEKALMELRNEIISDELSECFERGLIKYRNGDVAQKLHENCINLKTAWEENGAISETKLSSAELYRQKHMHANAKAISKDKVLTFDLSNLHVNNENTATRSKGFLNSKTGKIVAAAVATVIAISCYFVGKNKNKHPQDKIA